MPTRLVSASVKAPGFYGLNTQVSSSGLNMTWATFADNLVFDEGGTMRTRNGWDSVPSTAFTTDDITTLGEYRKNSTTEYLIAAANKKLYVSSTTTLIHDTWTDRTGTITTPTADYWQFVNHNGEVVGFQAAHVPCYYTGTGNFANLSAKAGYAAPDSSMAFGNNGLSAYGRVWSSDSTNTILLWSALGTNHQWSTASGGGFADLKITANAFANGIDKIKALAVFQNNLIVFGKRSILILAGADDPNNNLQITDTITGMGCIARDTVAHTGGDILFLDYTGVRSLGRAIVTQSVTQSDVSVNVHDDIAVNVLVDKANAFKNIRATYLPTKGFYLLIGSSSAIWCLDLKNPLDQGQARVTTWSNLAINDALVTNDELYFGFDGGYVGRYAGYDDNTAGSSFTYRSSWMDFDTTNVKIPKKLRVTYADGDSQIVQQCVAFDFAEYKSSCFLKQINANMLSSSEWSVSEWGIAEWGPPTDAYTDVMGNVGHYGHHLQVQVFGSIDETLNTTGVGIQYIELQVKVGRVSR